MDAPTLPDDFRDFLVALADAEVDFLLIGGFALAAYGYTRATDDLDVFVRPSPANAERVFAALAAFGAPVQQHGIRPDDFARAGYGHRMGIKPAERGADVQDRRHQRAQQIPSQEACTPSLDDVRHAG